MTAAGRFGIPQDTRIIWCMSCMTCAGINICVEAGDLEGAHRGAGAMRVRAPAREV